MSADPEPIVDELAQLLASLEQSWSRFDPDSELSRLNARSGEFTQVSEVLFGALSAAIDGSILTGGSFNPLVGQAVVDLGYDRTWLDLDLDKIAAAPTSVPPVSALSLSPQSHLVFFVRGTQIDLGAIGKGLAADLMLARAEDLGAQSAWISVGGDVAIGSFDSDSDPEPCVVGIDGMTRRLATTTFVSRGAVATSSPNVKKFSDGRHHIIDPSTGRSAYGEVASASVLASSCAVAEVVATALCVLPLNAGLSLIEDLGLACVCELDNGEIVFRSSPEHEVAL